METDSPVCIVLFDGCHVSNSSTIVQARNNGCAITIKSVCNRSVSQLSVRPQIQMSQTGTDSMISRLEEKILQHETAIEKLRATLLKLREAEAEAHALVGDTEPTQVSPAAQNGHSSRLAVRERHAKKKVGKRNGASGIIRTIARSFNGAFTIRDVMAAAEKSPLPEVRNLSESSATSTLFNWCNQGRLELVAERRGNKPSVYRVKGNALETMERKKSDRNKDFPLTDLIQETLKHMGQTFTKAQFYDKIVALHPQYVERLKLDSVGAKLNTLASQNKGVRFVERNPQGNTYGPA